MRIIGIYLPNGGSQEDMSFAFVEANTWEEADRKLTCHRAEIKKRKDMDMLYVMAFNVDTVEDITSDY